MSVAPVITIYVRHGKNKDGKECKYAGDEFARRCQCRKHLRWIHNGKRYRRKAETRSWAEAEEIKRSLEDQLAGRSAERKPDEGAQDLQTAITVFIEDKRVQGITEGVLGKYTRELARLREHCEARGVLIVQGITRELLTGYCATWAGRYPSTQTRSAVRSRTRAFLRYCYEAQWLVRIPALPKITPDERPTLPLSADEYARLLGAVVFFKDPERQRRIRALFQLMRWSGLAVRDALTLERAEIVHNATRGVYRVVTSRQKTGTHVSVPIPPAVAKELLVVPNETGRYIFWDGESDIVKTWTKYFIAPVFKAAKIPQDGYMLSHRLRDTFAVDLLEKGVPLEEVSKMLGHESIKTTEKSYARWVQGRQDRLDALVMATFENPR
jgi:integrase/recombinase XerD